MILVPIESAYATSYLSLMVTLVLSCTVSEIWRLIAENYVFFPPIRRPRLAFVVVDEADSDVPRIGWTGVSLR